MYLFFVIFYSFFILFLSAARQRIKPNELALQNAEHTINIIYPRSLTGETRDWRAKAVYNDQLASLPSEEYISKTKAQDKEDLILYENWFFGMKEGVLLESGACQGISLSLGYVFETFARWTTINVEPDPTVFRLLKRNRLNSINVFTALCSSEDKVFHYTDAMGLGGGEVRGFIEFMDPSFIKRHHPDIYNNKTLLDDLAKMRCLTVKNLFRILALNRIDVWILDVEGAEEEVLLGMDFNRVHVDVIVMENDGHNPTKDQRKLDILVKNQFDCTQIERNVFCKHESFIPSTKPNIAKTTTQSAYWDGRKWVHLVKK